MTAFLVRSITLATIFAASLAVPTAAEQPQQQGPTVHRRYWIDQDSLVWEGNIVTYHYHVVQAQPGRTSLYVSGISKVDCDGHRRMLISAEEHLPDGRVIKNSFNYGWLAVAPDSERDKFRQYVCSLKP